MFPQKPSWQKWPSAVRWCLSVSDLAARVSGNISSVMAFALKFCTRCSLRNLMAHCFRSRVVFWLQLFSYTQTLEGCTSACFFPCSPDPRIDLWYARTCTCLDCVSGPGTHNMSVSYKVIFVQATNLGKTVLLYILIDLNPLTLEGSVAYQIHFLDKATTRRTLQCPTPNDHQHDHHTLRASSDTGCLGATNHTKSPFIHRRRNIRSSDVTKPCTPRAPSR